MVVEGNNFFKKSFLSQFYYVPRQSNEEAYNLYCETTLLLFLPGANDKNFLHKNLADPQSELYLNPHEALYNFVHDNQSACPELIREEFKMALRQEAGEEVLLMSLMLISWCCLHWRMMTRWSHWMRMSWAWYVPGRT